MTFTDHDPFGTSARPSARARLDRVRLRVRRAFLRRRRLLAAGFAAVASWAALSSTAAPPEATVTVVVAARDLPAGTRLAAGDLRRVDFRSGTEPSGFLGGPAASIGRLLAAPMSAGEPITQVRLVGTDLAAAQPGLRAVPVRLPDPGMVALLEVGDLIDLVAADPEDGHVTTVAADVLVLALPSADTSGGSATASGLPGSLVVIGLTPGEVAPVASATLGSFVTYTWSGR